MSSDEDIISSDEDIISSDEDIISSDEDIISSDEEDLNLKPSDIIKENNAKTQSVKLAEKQERERLSNWYDQRIAAQKEFNDKQNTIFNSVEINDVNEPFPGFTEHEKCHAIWRAPITPYQCERINNSLHMIFNEHIYELYHTVACKETWYENIREFIAFHNNMEVDINTNELSDQEIVEIKDEGFSLFVGDDCANVDEDEFDGPNDLAVDEWELVDDIIMHYYLKYTPEL